MKQGILQRMICLAALPLLLCACASKPRQDLSEGTVVRGTYGPRTIYKGEEVASIQGNVESSVALPDGNGGVVLLPGVKHEPQNEGYVNARELKLKVRELAEQLIADMRDCSLQGTVALPTSFVNLNDFNETSALGRLISEQLFFELNQRGYPVREYRIPGSVRVKPKQGEYYLSRALGDVSARSGNAVVIVGTYSNAKDAVFVNARLVRPKDGRVLRTANLVLDGNPLLTRMMRASGGSHLALGGSGGGSGMQIKDFERTMRPPAPQNLTPFDKGEDIH